MVNLSVDFPDIPDPDIQIPFHFIKLCSEDNPQAKNLFTDALEKCSALRERYPDDATIFNLSAVVSFICLNSDAAARFRAEAIILDPGYDPPRKSLEELLAGDGFWDGADAYLAAMKNGVDFIFRKYLEKAHGFFADGDYFMADRFGQMASAIVQTEFSALEDYKTCLNESLKLMAEDKLDSGFRAIAEGYQAYWASADRDYILNSIARDKDLPDRKQLASLVAGLIEGCGSEKPLVFELGCFAGYNMILIRDALPEGMAGKVGFAGLEPNSEAVEYCRENYPWIDIRQGDHGEMISGAVPIPGRIDICIISRVLMILHPEDATAILGYLKDRVGRLVICDDIMNVEGEFPVLRGTFIVMHDFRKILEAAGFEIRDVIMAGVPDRECTGFIVADSRREIP